MFSVVIPTHNRAPILKRSLTHLLALEGISECEIIVVNDGSTDGTEVILEELLRSPQGYLKVFTISNGGPARARNYGVSVAKNQRILFVDDDVFPRPGMLHSHWKALEQGYVGSQGLLLWHDEIARTPLIRYIDSRGSQFAFDQVEDPSRLGFQFVYTGNFAVEKRAFLESGGFDETLFNRNLGFSAFEDTVLGYCLVEKGARLALTKDAVADHLHAMDEKSFFEREYKVGYCIGVLKEKHPAIARSLGLKKKGTLVEFQSKLLEKLNTQRVVRDTLGYSFRMRLRHREAFYRGFRQFQQDTAKHGLPGTQ